MNPHHVILLYFIKSIVFIIQIIIIYAFFTGVTGNRQRLQYIQQSNFDSAHLNLTQSQPTGMNTHSVNQTFRIPQNGSTTDRYFDSQTSYTSQSSINSSGKFCSVIFLYTGNTIQFS